MQRLNQFFFRSHFFRHGLIYNFWLFLHFFGNKLCQGHAPRENNSQKVVNLKYRNPTLIHTYYKYTFSFDEVNHLQQNMSLEYTEISEIMERDDPRFNKIWDEETSVEEEETNEGSQPGSTAAKLSKDPILTIESPVKIEHEKVRISSFTVGRNESIVSTISRSTSSSSSIDMTSFLVNSPINREVSDITLPRVMKKPKKCYNSSLDGILDIYDSMVGENPLKVSCVSEEVVQKNRVHIPPLFVKESKDADDTIVASKLEATNVGLRQENLFPSKVGQENTDATKCNGCLFQSTPKSMFHNIFMNDSEPIASIPEFFASVASRFSSSHLDVDEISNVSISFMEDDGENDSLFDLITLEQMPEKIVADEKELDNTELGEKGFGEKRLEGPSLFDSLSTEEPMELARTEAAKELPDNKIVNSLEEENMTEGLGLTLPSTSKPIKLQNLEAKNLPDSNLEMIEVDATGKISIDRVDSSSGSTGSISHKKEDSSSRRDVYLSYRIEQSESYDTESSSQVSETSNSSLMLTPKHHSKLISFFKPRWGKKIKLFSGINNSGYKSIKRKPIKSICDSPGAATVETETSMVTFAALSFGEDHPVNPRKLSYFLRPRTKE